MSVARTLSILVIAVPLLACDTSQEERVWEQVECSDEDRSLIERGIAEALAVDAHVSEGLADRYTGDVPTYSELTDFVIDAHARGAIVCTRARGDEELTWAARAVLEGELILIHVESSSWLHARAAWVDGQRYGSLTAAEVAVEVAELDAEGFWEFRERAYDYLGSPAYAARLLVHEAAHHARPGCCPHGDEQVYERGCDYVDTMGWLTVRCVLWNRWVTESQWLEQVYYQTRPEDE